VTTHQMRPASAGITNASTARVQYASFRRIGDQA
jgi:hypothetical protein